MTVHRRLLLKDLRELRGVLGSGSAPEKRKPERGVEYGFPRSGFIDRSLWHGVSAIGTLLCVVWGGVFATVHLHYEILKLSLQFRHNSQHYFSLEYSLHFVR